MCTRPCSISAPCIVCCELRESGVKREVSSTGELIPRTMFNVCEVHRESQNVVFCHICANVDAFYSFLS